MDLTAMNRSNTDNGQPYVLTGIHWQVAQATSLQNIDFIMPVSDAAGATTAVGIFMENGSGGFLSELTFFGGNIGFRAGSQQYTVRNVLFNSRTHDLGLGLYLEEHLCPVMLRCICLHQRWRDRRSGNWLNNHPRYAISLGSRCVSRWSAK